ncbi:MAG: hypothetical protein HRT89_04455, partial [Lentisphaeria bacterium]|nr:hypothetical protein [Lentisphaeria bacterium]NQZ67298.1 hypothetical protein [Lentisphaeria bacterium]
MLAGATEIEITPPIGGMIMGPEAISTGVHDPLMAKALYVDDGQSPWFILSIDLMALDFALSDRIRQEITARTGAKAVILNFTHTHAAPYSAPWSVPEFEKHCELEKDWRESLVTKIPDLAVAAKAQAESVSLKVGRAPVAIGVHRRVWNGELMTMAPNFHGPIIPWVDVLEARTADGKLIGVVFSHAAHPVVVHMTSTEMGADFPGYAAAALRDEYGEGIFLFCQACSANINSYPLATGEKNAEHAGRKLAAATILAMS